MNNVWEEAKYNLEQAAEVMGMKDDILERLSTPMRFTEFTIPVRMDDGTRKVFMAYRSNHQDATGPTKDGTRVKPDLTPEEIKALSLFMSIKHGIGNIPAGGGKGGIKADPSRMSEGEYERLIRGFVRKLKPKGAWVDVPGADIGTGKQAMAWMLDEYEQITGMHCPAAINDKPAILGLGGSKGGFEATGWGVAMCTLEASEELGFTPEKTGVVIQGFGQVGSITAKTLYDRGFRITAVSDINGAIEKEDGLDIDLLMEHVEKTGSVAGFENSTPMDESLLLEKECHILIPAAVQDVINADNAPRIRAKLIVEAANAPTTPEADRILEEKGIPVIPDVLANAGGCIVCDFERIQGLSGDYWDEDEVHRRLDKRMMTAYREAVRVMKEKDISMRRAVWVNALTKIVEAMEIRGWS
jgi:glutamate dehydrogenase/leucine dehydrogenase